MRQSRNAQHIYAATDLPWLAHLDVDEFLLHARDDRSVFVIGDAVDQNGELLDAITGCLPFIDCEVDRRLQGVERTGCREIEGGRRLDTLHEEADIAELARQISRQNAVLIQGERAFRLGNVGGEHDLAQRNGAQFLHQITVAGGSAQR